MANSISGSLPYPGVRVTARESYINVSGQPIVLGAPKVIFSSKRGGSLTIHLWWERAR